MKTESSNILRVSNTEYVRPSIIGNIDGYTYDGIHARAIEVTPVVSLQRLFASLPYTLKTCLQTETMRADTFVACFQYILPIKFISASANGWGASMAVKCPPYGISENWTRG